MSSAPAEVVQQTARPGGRPREADRGDGGEPEGLAGGVTRRRSPTRRGLAGLGYVRDTRSAEHESGLTLTALATPMPTSSPASSSDRDLAAARGTPRRRALEPLPLPEPPRLVRARRAPAASPPTAAVIGSSFARTSSGVASSPTPCSAVNGPTRVRRSVCTSPPQPSFVAEVAGDRADVRPLPAIDLHVQRTASRSRARGPRRCARSAAPATRPCRGGPGRVPAGPPTFSAENAGGTCSIVPDERRQRRVDLLARSAASRSAYRRDRAVGVVGVLVAPSRNRERVASCPSPARSPPAASRRRRRPPARPSPAGRACRCGRSSSSAGTTAGRGSPRPARSSRPACRSRVARSSPFLPVRLAGNVASGMSGRAVRPLAPVPRVTPDVCDLQPGGRPREGPQTLLEAARRRFGADVELRPTDGAWHAAELARKAADEGFARVVAAGGDGTVHEVANGSSPPVGTRSSCRSGRSGRRTTTPTPSASRGGGPKAPADRWTYSTPTSAWCGPPGGSGSSSTAAASGSTAWSPSSPGRSARSAGCRSTSWRSSRRWSATSPPRP